MATREQKLSSLRRVAYMTFILSSIYGATTEAFTAKLHNRNNPLQKSSSSTAFSTTTRLFVGNDRAHNEKIFEDMMGDDWRYVTDVCV